MGRYPGACRVGKNSYRREQIDASCRPTSKSGAGGALPVRSAAWAPAGTCASVRRGACGGLRCRAYRSARGRASRHAHETQRVSGAGGVVAVGLTARCASTTCGQGGPLRRWRRGGRPPARSAVAPWASRCGRSRRRGMLAHVDGLKRWSWHRTDRMPAAACSVCGLYGGCRFCRCVGRRDRLSRAGRSLRRATYPLSFREVLRLRRAGSTRADSCVARGAAEHQVAGAKAGCSGGCFLA